MQKQVYEVRESKIHHKGVFATTDIKKDQKILEYVGEKITVEEGDKRAIEIAKKAKLDKNAGAVYIFKLNDKYDLDGNIPNNPAMYVNHSCDPNAEAIDEDEHIWVVATKDIKQGEEITYNYGYDWEDYKEHPCKCGAKNCVGYILDEDLWPKLRQELNKKKRLVK